MNIKPETKQIEVSDEQLIAVGIKWWVSDTKTAGYNGFFLWENRTLFKKFVGLPLEVMALETARDYAVEMYKKFDVAWAR